MHPPKTWRAPPSVAIAEALVTYLAALKARGASRREHFGAHLGIEILDVQSDRVTMRMPYRPELRRGGGIFHGGAIMALADHVAGCVFNTDPRIAASGSTGLTTDFSVSFLRPAEQGEAALGTGWVLRRGRNVTFMQIDVRAEASGPDDRDVPHDLRDRRAGLDRRGQPAEIRNIPSQLGLLRMALALMPGRS